MPVQDHAHRRPSLSMRLAGAAHRVLDLADRERRPIAAASTAALAAATVAPILMTPFRADDTVNQGIAAGFAASGQPLVVNLWQVAFAFTKMWAETQGRFFPGSVVWTQTVFAVFSDRTAYKAFLALVSLVMIAAAAALAVAVARRAAAAPLMVAALATTVTLRFPFFDGLDSFAGLLPWTILATLLAVALLIRGRRWPSALLAVALWTVALLTYEVVIVLTPFVVLAVLLSRRGWRRALAVVWPVLADIVLVLYLRHTATAVTPAYTTSFAPHDVLRTYVRQTVAALPLAQVWYPGAADFAISKRLVLVVLLTVGLAAGALMLTLYRARVAVPARSLIVLAGFGAGAWLATPVLIAVTLRWQTELPPGQGYLTVVWGYVGVALVTAAAWLALSTWRARRPGRLPAALLGVLSTVIVLTAVLNTAQSYTVVQQLLQAMNATSTLAG